MCGAVAYGTRLWRRFQQGVKQRIASALRFLLRKFVGRSRFHMGLGHKRTDLQAYAQAKLNDAVILLQNERYSNAYYLAGYAVELGLKACIARQINAQTIPDKAFIKNILNHEFPGLVGLAGLATELKDQKDKDPVFAANWAIASEWSPDARYETSDVTSAQTMITAIAHPDSGVLQWIKIHW